MWVLCPVLRAKSPTFLFVVGAPVFCINEQDIHAHIGLFTIHEASQFKQHAHAAGTIVGTHHRHIALCLVGVGICPRASVPVSHEQDALLGVGIDNTYIISGIERFAVESGKARLLGNHLIAPATQLCLNPFAALFVSLSFGHTRTKVTLLFHKSECAVGVKIHSGNWLWHRVGIFSRTVRSTARTARSSQSHGGNKAKYVMHLHLILYLQSEKYHCSLQS